VFDIDIEHFPKCIGRLKTIGAIDATAVIEHILAYLSLTARAPPLMHSA
jgi:hypothetical protein